MSAATAQGRFLLDTATWLKYFQRPEHLPGRVREVLGGEHRLCLSWISLWELKHQTEQGKVRLPVPVAEWLQFATPRSRVQLVDLDPETNTDSTNLPGDFPADHVERVIVATARRHHLTVVTSDERILKCPHVQTLDAR